MEHTHRLPMSVRLEIHIVDPGDCGQGSDPASQPDHLLINTVASQVTMFAPLSLVGGDGGVSLVQWAHASGYRRVGERFVRDPAEGGESITEFDYLPRKILGEYLSWVYQRIVSLLPPSISVRHRRALLRKSARGEIPQTPDGFMP
ncbi:FAD/NAD(P)-binding protein [Burkholderia vietnamiensis]|nr:FAD/NAD(P)-binding protein [Burkholderia vietnamiensis]